MQTGQVQLNHMSCIRRSLPLVRVNVRSHAYVYIYTFEAQNKLTEGYSKSLVHGPKAQVRTRKVGLAGGESHKSENVCRSLS